MFSLTPKRKDIVMNEKLKKEIFSNVCGYDDVKDELLLVKSWYQDDAILNDPLITLPKGIIFYGVPGCGKTLLMREYSNSFDCPKYVVEGNTSNVSDEIHNTFLKAREDKFAIVLIDEIDLLIAKNAQSLRVIQQELDGIDNKGSILVLASTNNFYDIPDSLLRSGRFDRKISINRPDRESRKELFIKFLTEFGISVNDINLDHIARVCARLTCSDVKAVCNDLYLRCKTNVSTEEVEKSYHRILDDEYGDSTKINKNIRVAVHEVGHSLMALHFKENWSFYSAYFNNSGGYTIINELNENEDTVQKREQKIMISLAGYLAEEVIYKDHDVGSYSDYQKAFDLCTRLIERVCIKGIKHLIPSYSDNSDRYESMKKREENEKLVQKLFNKYEKQVRKFLRKNKETINTLSNKMFENGRLTYKDITNVSL